MKKTFKYFTKIKKYPVNAKTALMSYFKYYHRSKRLQVYSLGCNAILFEVTFYQRKLNIYLHCILTHCFFCPEWVNISNIQRNLINYVYI